MTLRSSVRRLEQSAASRPKTDADRWREDAERRRSVLIELVQAIEDAGYLPEGLEREVYSVLRAYSEPLLVDGSVPCDERLEGWYPHPLAQFAQYLTYPGAALPTPFPVALLEALCDSDARRVSQHGCRRCEVMLPERLAPGGRPIYGPYEFVLPTCPVCGSDDLGFVVRRGDGLRRHRVEVPT